jgi:hypothetical protein
MKIKINPIREERRATRNQEYQDHYYNTTAVYYTYIPPDQQGSRN